MSQNYRSTMASPRANFFCKNIPSQFTNTWEENDRANHCLQRQQFPQPRQNKTRKKNNKKTVLTLLTVQKLDEKASPHNRLFTYVLNVKETSEKT